MKSLNKYIKESILDDEEVLISRVEKNSDKDFGNIILDKLIRKESLTETELKWVRNKVGIVKVNEKQLKSLIKNLKYNGISLNWLDVNNIIDMSFIFYNSQFNGDISKWNVSNVKSTSCMFSYSDFNGDISKWDVSNVKSMYNMFSNSQFNGDISKWNVSNVASMGYMFYNSKFNGDISKWDVSNVVDMNGMFADSKFNKDISKWNIDKQCDTLNIFYKCPIKEEYKPEFFK